MLSLLQWYFGSGLLVLFTAAFIFIPGRGVVPFSKAELCWFLFCLLIWPIIFFIDWNFDEIE